MKMQWLQGFSLIFGKVAKICFFFCGGLCYTSLKRTVQGGDVKKPGFVVWNTTKPAMREGPD
jgi:hypothetical protein